MPKEYPPTELRELAERNAQSEAARSALRFVADLFELGADWRVSAEAIGIRVRNQLNHL